MSNSPHSDHTTAPGASAIAEALERVCNLDGPLLDCMCGNCLNDEYAGYADLALDASMRAGLGMIDAVECSPLGSDPHARLAMQALRELLANARMLVCMQRAWLRVQFGGGLEEAGGSECRL